MNASSVQGVEILGTYGSPRAALDAAEIATYGLNTKKGLPARLLALNLGVAARIEKRESVNASDMPKNYPHPQKLVTEDCIRPAPA